MWEGGIVVLEAALIGWVPQQNIAYVDVGRCWLDPVQGASGESEEGCVEISGS